MAVRPMTAGPHLILIYQPSQAHGWPTELGQSAGLTMSWRGAVGLGGRDRRAASHAERARLNVTRAIRAAMAKLARANPSPGQQLAATIPTGRYCSYTLDPRAPITWGTLTWQVVAGTRRPGGRVRW
jgi:hypothetical protein